MRASVQVQEGVVDCPCLYLVVVGHEGAVVTATGSGEGRKERIRARIRECQRRGEDGGELGERERASVGCGGLGRHADPTDEEWQSFAISACPSGFSRRGKWERERERDLAERSSMQ